MSDAPPKEARHWRERPLQVTEEQALGQVVKGNQGHPLEGDASALEKGGRLLKLLDEPQEALAQIFASGAHMREVEGHPVRIRARVGLSAAFTLTSFVLHLECRSGSRELGRRRLQWGWRTACAIPR